MISPLIFLQVQLVQKLEARSAPVNGQRTSPRESEDAESDAAGNAAAGIPVVRMSRSLTAGGMLTERQRTWIQGFPNEVQVENPILYK